MNEARVRGHEVGRRGLNISGVLDRRDDRVITWHHVDELEQVREAGFTSVRLPVRWWGHCGSGPDLIDPAFAQQVDDLVGAALSFDLGVVLSMHHADDVMAARHGADDRLIAVWAEITDRYRGVEDLAFDVLNEPRDHLTARAWNELLPAVLHGIWSVDDARELIVSSAGAGSVSALPDLHLPADDRITASVHYYEPMDFTHQGATWLQGMPPPGSRRWGSESQRVAVTRDLEKMRAWSDTEGVPLYVGEFGVHEAADERSRLAWIGWVRHELDRLGLSWAFWDYETDFGLLDPETRRWRRPLLGAVIGT